MSQLQDNLNEILRQKNQVLIPANVKVGTQYLGQTGAYTSDANAVAADILSGKTAYVNGVKLTGTHVDGHDNVKMFSSVAAMNADADKALGDIAIVYDTTTGVTRNIQENDVFHKMAFPSTFTLSSKPAVCDYVDELKQASEPPFCSIGFYNAITNTEVDGHAMLITVQAGLPNADPGYTIDYDLMSIGSGVRGCHVSTDGVNWSIPSGESMTASLDLEGSYKFGNPTTNATNPTNTDWKLVLPLLRGIFNGLLGLYEVRSVSNVLTYMPLETQLTPIAAGDVYTNKVVMGNNNTIVTGTLEVNQTEVNTAVDTTENILGEPEIPDPVNEGPGEDGLED